MGLIIKFFDVFMEHWNISVKELFRYNIGTLNQINRATNTNFILLFLLTYIDSGNPGHTKQKEFKNCIIIFCLI